MTITDLFMTGNNEWWMDLEQGIRAGQDLRLTLFVTPGELQISETNPTAQQAMREAIHHIAYTVAQCEVSPQGRSPSFCGGQSGIFKLCRLCGLSRIRGSQPVWKHRHLPPAHGGAKLQGKPLST